MPIACAPPDAQLGVALRLSTYLDCQGRALGENGFQAIVGGPVQVGLLSGLVTIFVALIGYRLILGYFPSVRDGVSWSVRLGLVLALTTGWPAFQTLIYRVATDGPGELAAVILPASGLPDAGLDERVQTAYDTMRLGAALEPSPAGPDAADADRNGEPPQQRSRGPATGEFAYPQTASIFVVATTGVTGALRLAIGFLLAIAPLALLGLLFDTTLSLVSGWLKALAGAAVALIAATVVTAVDLAAVEGELAHIQRYTRGMVDDVLDPQALTTMVLIFVVVMLVSLVAATRLASALWLPLRRTDLGTIDRLVVPAFAATASHVASQSTAANGMPTPLGQTRAGAIADALALSVRRDHTLSTSNGSIEPPSRRVSIVEAAARGEPGVERPALGTAGRRTTGRRTRSAATRDRLR